MLALILVAVLSLRLKNQSKRHSEQIKNLSQSIHPLQAEIRQLENLLHEFKTGSLGVGDRVKKLESKMASFNDNVDALKEKHTELENADPSSRLYSKAAKLVAAGATIEEVMEECDLPRAEAELLMNLHRTD